MCVPGYSGLICKQSLAVSYRVWPGYSGLICKQSLAVSYRVCAWIQWADMQAKSSKCHIMCVPGYSGLICKQSLAVSYHVCA